MGQFTYHSPMDNIFSLEPLKKEGFKNLSKKEMLQYLDYLGSLAASSHNTQP